MFRGLAVITGPALFMLVAVPDASATQTFCGVVRRTPDEFVALRAGPGTKHRMVKRLRPSESVEIDSGMCRRQFCDESRQWVFVEGPGQQGWVRDRYIKYIDCKEPG